MNYENASRISSQNKLTDLLKPTVRTANPGAGSANGLGWMSTYQVFRQFLKFKFTNSHFYWALKAAERMTSSMTFVTLSVPLCHHKRMHKQTTPCHAEVNAVL